MSAPTCPISSYFSTYLDWFFSNSRKRFLDGFLVSRVGYPTPCEVLPALLDDLVCLCCGSRCWGSHGLRGGCRLFALRYHLLLPHGDLLGGGLLPVLAEILSCLLGYIFGFCSRLHTFSCGGQKICLFCKAIPKVFHHDEVLYSSMYAKIFAVFSTRCNTLLGELHLVD